VKLRASLGALHERPFRLLFLASAASLLGDRFVPVALAFATLDLTGSTADLGYVLAAWWVPQVVLLLFSGVIADRASRRTLMLAADLVRFAAQAVLAVLLLTHAATLWQLVVLQVVRGAASAFFNPASVGLMPQVVTAANLQQANALRGLVQWTAGIVGPGAAGGLVVAFGPGWAIAVDSASFLWSALFLLQIHVPAIERPPHPPNFLRELVEGWREVRTRSWLLAIVLWALFANPIVFTSTDVLGPATAKLHYGGAGAWGILGTCAGVGAVAGGLAMLNLRFRRPLFVGTCCAFAEVLLVVALAAHPPLAVTAAAAVVAGASAATFGVLWETALQQSVPHAALSRVSAYDWLGSVALIPVGNVLAGRAGHAFGVSQALWGCAAIGLVLNLAILAVPSVRRLEAPPR